MSKKKNKKEKKKKVGSEKQSRVLQWTVLALIVAAAVVFAHFRNSDPGGLPNQAKQSSSAPEPSDVPQYASEPLAIPEQPAPEQKAGFRMPPYLEDVSSVQLPPTKLPSSVTPAAQEAYYVAGEKPELLAQLPCFCYCDRFGHSSLHTCFVTDHAEQCDICLKEALEANVMDQEGITVPEIRELIVAKYGHTGHSH